jgi:hypothetical protein
MRSVLFVTNVLIANFYSDLFREKKNPARFFSLHHEIFKKMIGSNFAAKYRLAVEVRRQSSDFEINRPKK